MTSCKFKPGAIVRNIKSPQPRYRGKVGKFIALLPGTFYSKDDEHGRPVLEPACDVEYEGECDLYGNRYIAQRVSDLELVTESEAS